MGEVELFMIQILFTVAVLIPLVVWFVMRERGVRSPQTTGTPAANVAALLAAYFGTHRPEGWRPIEGVREYIMDILERASQKGVDVSILQYLLGDEPPYEIEENHPEFAVRASAIGDVCRALYSRE